MTLTEAHNHIGDLVRVSPVARRGRGPHWMRAKLLGVHSRGVVIQPSGHKKPETVDAKYVKAWRKSGMPPCAIYGR